MAWITGKQMGGGNGAANGPGDAFAGEGFDVTAGITDGQNAMSAELFAPAGEAAGTGDGGIMGGRETMAGGFKEIAHDRERSAGGVTLGGVEGRANVDARIIQP